MKRIHLLEFEDLDWFPSWLRTCMTNLIVIIARWLGVPSVMSRLVRRVVTEEGIDQIVDLGSGGGGSMPEVLAKLREQPQTSEVTLTMTDLYPNLDAVETFNRSGDPHLRYSRDSVDATDLATAPPGLKTMVNCFHHMRPPQARAILASAQSSRQPLLVYEMGNNDPPFWLWVVLLPISLPLVGAMVFIMTPFVRPLTLRQLLFTYVIPIVPIFYAWDGMASGPRIYTPGDLDELLEGLPTEGYRWEKGAGQTDSGRTLGTYLLGLPTEAAAE